MILAKLLHLTKDTFGEHSPPQRLIPCLTTENKRKEYLHEHFLSLVLGHLFQVS